MLTDQEEVIRVMHNSTMILPYLRHRYKTNMEQKENKQTKEKQLVGDVA